MKFNKKFDIEPSFESLFSSKTKKEELEHEAKMIMFRFIGEIEKLKSDKPLKKKELAKALGTSASYITQLYRGDKLVNLTTLAKLQDVYDLIFEIKAKLNSENYAEEVDESFDPSRMSNKMNNENGFRVFINKNPDYTSNVSFVDKKPNLKVA